MAPAEASKQRWIKLVSPAVIILGLFLSSRYSYLLFHSLSELFSIVVAAGIFMVAWNSRRFFENKYLLLLGVAYLFIGGIDLFHTLSYKGMAIFPGYGPNLPTQFWIAARYVESLTFLAAPFLISRNIKTVPIFISYLVAVALIFLTIFAWDVFPVCFVEGRGLTPFKIISEYVISFLLIISIALLVNKRDEFDFSILKLIVASIILKVFAELAFTFYISVYGLSNLVGHIFKIISFYLIYKAIIETGLVRPYNLLFRNLKKNEEELRAQRDNLQQALDEIKTLKGILPICANCKKIRDDEGYWNQIEGYIRKHSQAEFSHGICPDCAKKLYPELDMNK